MNRILFLSLLAIWSSCLLTTTLSAPTNPQVAANDQVASDSSSNAELKHLPATAEDIKQLAQKIDELIGGQQKLVSLNQKLVEGNRKQSIQLGLMELPKVTDREAHPSWRYECDDMLRAFMKGAEYEIVDSELVGPTVELARDLTGLDIRDTSGKVKIYDN